jgi:thiol-disulfide isomerase/thioredoxin
VVEALVLAARLVLAACFAVAGGAKLADREGTREAVVAFGAPARLAGPLALILPVAELSVAALLLFSATAVAGAAAALGLLVLFSAAIAVSLARGQAPECHCFGQLHSSPAGRRTLARNGALAAMAAFALVGGLHQGNTSAVAWVGRLEGAEILALVVGVGAVSLLAVGTVAFLSLLRSYGQVLTRLDRVEQQLADAGIEPVKDDLGPPPELGFKPGTPAPTFTASDSLGRSISLTELLAPGLPALLVFTSAHCGPCKALLPAAAAWQRRGAGVLTVAFASAGSLEDVRADAEEFELDHVLLDEGGRIYDAFRGNGTPSAVLVAADGTIGSWVAPGRDWIEALAAKALAGPPSLPLGAPAPALQLPSLDGETVALSQFKGRNTLVVFWNPGCGFCRSMHEDLLAWEAGGTGNGKPQLVVVSFGDAESTRAEGFGSPILLDEGFTLGNALGASGTPMAVLLDADGRIASEVAAGPDAVLELAGAEAR